jgi:hypothetical protein
LSGTGSPDYVRCTTTLSISSRRATYAGVRSTLPWGPHADGSTALISLYLCWSFSLRRHSRQPIRVRLRKTKGHYRRSSALCLLRIALRALLLFTFLSGPVDAARSGSLVGIARTGVCCTEAQNHRCAGSDHDRFCDHFGFSIAPDPQGASRKQVNAKPNPLGTGSATTGEKTSKG